MAGVLILGIVIVTSLLIFFERQKRLRSANERILVWQVLANEVETERRLAFNEIDITIPTKQCNPDDPKFTGTSFCSDLTLLKPLDGLVTLVKGEDIAPGVKHVTLDVGWNDRKVRRHAKLTIVRVDTGGGQLW